MELKPLDLGPKPRNLEPKPCDLEPKPLDREPRPRGQEPKSHDREPKSHDREPKSRDREAKSHGYEALSCNRMTLSYDPTPFSCDLKGSENKYPARLEKPLFLPHAINDHRSNIADPAPNSFRAKSRTQSRFRRDHETTLSLDAKQEAV